MLSDITAALNSGLVFYTEVGSRRCFGISDNWNVAELWLETILSHGFFPSSR